MIKIMLNRIFCLLAGLLCALLIIEAGLFVLGRFYTSHPKPSAQTQADFVILCLGDSRTYGIGAQKGLSYPQQLQNKLNSVYGEKTILVLNGGMSRDNTSQMKNKLRSRLMSGQKPNLVIFLGGQSNFWNFTGFNNAQKTAIARIIQNLHSFRLVAQLKRALRKKQISPKQRIHNLRTSPLFKELIKEDITLIRNSLPKNTQLNVPKHPASADIEFWQQELLKKEVSRNEKGQVEILNTLIALSLLKLNEPDSTLASLFSQAACVYKSMGKDNTACLYFTHAMQTDPAEVSYKDLCLILFQKQLMVPALRSSLRHLCLYPDDSFAFIAVILWLMRTNLPMLKDTIEKYDLPVPADLKTIIYNDKNKEDIINWIESDMNEMITDCKALNIAVFLLGDINQQFAEPWIYSKLANQCAVEYINTQQLLVNQIEQSQTLSKKSLAGYLSGDHSHPNAKGYAFMADCIVNKIQELGLLKE